RIRDEVDESQREDVAPQNRLVAKTENDSQGERKKVIGRIGDVEEGGETGPDKPLHPNGHIDAEESAVGGDQEVVPSRSSRRRDQISQGLVEDGNERRRVKIE